MARESVFMKRTCSDCCLSTIGENAMTGPASSEVTTQNATFNTIVSVVALLAIIVLIYFIARGRTSPPPPPSSTLSSQAAPEVERAPNPEPAEGLS